ncbi:hypothetical protein B296_00005692 [Ensete ventricosum]|uniref:Uncharacterized protein n=1 Tax=Ensete ventricosum TaxID=4639 RepID=A0A426ZL95_ENSVE|nr:hypothetical protein B296_00005692 [Ensete ventricosum]
MSFQKRNPNLPMSLPLHIASHCLLCVATILCRRQARIYLFPQQPPVHVATTAITGGRALPLRAIAAPFTSKRPQPVRPPFVGGCTVATYARLLRTRGRRSTVVLLQSACCSHAAIVCQLLPMHIATTTVAIMQ